MLQWQHIHLLVQTQKQGGEKKRRQRPLQLKKLPSILQGNEELLQFTAHFCYERI